MSPQLTHVINVMKECKVKVATAILIGGIVPDLEVTANSFIQLVEWQPARGAWSYYQCRVATLTEAQKNMFIGAYLNETVGHFKIIGIYDWIDPK